MWAQAVELVRLMLACGVFAFVVKEHCSQNDLCPAGVYLPGP